MTQPYTMNDIVREIRRRIEASGLTVEENWTSTHAGTLFAHRGDPEAHMFTVHLDFANSALTGGITRAGERLTGSGIYRRLPHNGTSVPVDGRTFKAHLDEARLIGRVMDMVSAECMPREVAHAPNVPPGMSDSEASFVTAVRDVTFDEGADVAMGRIIAFLIKRARDEDMPELLDDAAAFMSAPGTSPRP